MAGGKTREELPGAERFSKEAPASGEQTWFSSWFYVELFIWGFAEDYWGNQ